MTGDFDPFGRETTSDLQTLSQDVLHVLMEVLNSNLDDPNRGLGVMGYLNGTLSDLQLLPAKIDQQLLDDDRITSSETTISDVQPDGSYLISIQIVVNGQVWPLNYNLSPSGLVAV